MKKDGILNQRLLNVLGSPGHTDWIVVCDARVRFLAMTLLAE